MQLQQLNPSYLPDREVKLNSTALDAVTYHSQAKELEVSFASGSSYLYQAVEPETFEELLSAPSAGRYFSQAIRNTYSYRKLG